MYHTHSFRLFALSVSALVACANSSSSSDSLEDATSPSVDAEGAGDAGRDVGLPDTSASTDAAVVDYDPEGTPCDPQLPSTLLLQASCGQCGVKLSACLAVDPDASDTKYAYGPWGICTQEKTGPNNCDPSLAYESDVDAGVCFVASRSCASDCTFVNAIVPQLDAQCEPGYTQYIQGASCTDGFRTRTCGDSCKWDPYSDCQSNDPSGSGIVTITPSEVVADTRYAIFEAASRKTFYYGGTCHSPDAWSVGTAADYTYVVVRVVNPGMHDMTVNAVLPPNIPGASLPDLMLVYNREDLPSDLSECDLSLLSPTGFVLYNQALPAGGSFLVFMARHGTERAEIAITLQTNGVSQ